jgi:Flp pilus assembly protein TadD
MLSIIGVTMDQLGEHNSAQDYYLRALTLSPGNARVMSNLGLSQALAGDPVRAEETLRQAANLEGADMRVRQNLALVLGLQGKFAEAASAAGPETPSALVEANADYFRTLLTPARNWDNLRGTSE